MIYYIPDPMQLFSSEEETNRIRLALPSGGVVIAESISSSEYMVRSVISTDPQDYLSFHPGEQLQITFSRQS